MSVSLYSDMFGISREKRLQSIRFIGPVGGEYSLARRPGTDPARPKTLACRLQSISPQQLVITAPVKGQVGELVSVKLDDFDIIDGKISHLVDDGFAIEIFADEDEQRAIALKIDWIKKHRFQSAKDKRAQKRFVPQDPRSVITLPGGKTETCLVMNISQSGLALSADVTPRNGTRVGVGKVIGTVVRPLDVGFAVKFDEPMEMAELTKVFGPPPDYTGKQPAAKDAV